jgi:hypothetical protein
VKGQLRLVAVAAGVGLVLVGNGGAAGGPVAPKEPNTLAAPESFASINYPQKRSAAYFTELGKVFTHQRCVNCHPAVDSPRQGDTLRLHQPPVSRGPDGFGLESMRCGTCHQDANFEPGRMPGHKDWHLAPPEMAWEGKTVSQICEQIKDPKRNGNRSLHDLAEHIGKDSLVGWAWAPGFGRTPAPFVPNRTATPCGSPVLPGLALSDCDHVADLHSNHFAGDDQFDAAVLLPAGGCFIGRHWLSLPEAFGGYRIRQYSLRG